MIVLKGRRTQLIAALIMAVGLFEQHARELVPADYQGWALFVAGLLMIIMRQITTTPPGKRDA